MTACGVAHGGSQVLGIFLRSKQCTLIHSYILCTICPNYAATHGIALLKYLHRDAELFCQHLSKTISEDGILRGWDVTYYVCYALQYYIFYVPLYLPNASSCFWHVRGGNHRCGESRLENRRLVHVIVDIIFWFEICRSSIYFPSNYLLRIVLFSSTSRRAVYGTCNFVLFVDSQLERVTLPINLSRHGRLHMSVVHECHHLCLYFSVAQGKRQSNSTHFEYLIHVAQELIFSGTIDHRCCNCQFTKEFISFI